MLPCGTPVSSVVKLSSARLQRLGDEIVLLTTSQPRHHLRNLLNRLRMRQRFRRRRHTPQPPRITDQVRSYVRSNPGKALLISVGVGFLVGLLLRRDDSD